MPSPEIKLIEFRNKWHAIIGTGRSARRISLRTADRGLAERRVADLRRSQAQISGGTNRDIYEAYLKDREAQKLPTETIKFSWRALKPHFGALTPAQITREECRRYIEARRALKRRDGSIIRELGVLRSAIRWQNKATPAVFEMPEGPAPKEIHLTKDEFLALRQAAAITPHLNVFIELAKSTGARAGAILELKWDRVDFPRGLIRLATDDRPVNNKLRPVVPMTDSLRAVLVEARRAALTPFVVEFAGRPLKSVRTAFERAARDIQRPDIGPHAIRHSVAVWMAEADVSMSEIAQYLGHADERMTTRVYARYRPSFLRRAASVLDF